MCLFKIVMHRHSWSTRLVSCVGSAIVVPFSHVHVCHLYCNFAGILLRVFALTGSIRLFISSPHSHCDSSTSRLLPLKSNGLFSVSFHFSVLISWINCAYRLIPLITVLMPIKYGKILSYITSIHILGILQYNCKTETAT